MSTVETKPGEIFDTHNQTILIVDDEPANLAVVVDYLASYGFQIKVARTGESGLELAQQTQPDLILLDVMLPGIDGLETCRRLQADERTRDIPVIFMTIMTRVEDKVKGFEAGGVDYITKPFQYEEILARVTTHLRQRWLTRSLQAQNEQLQQAQAALRQANEVLELRVAERTTALTAERNLLRTLIDNLPDLIYVKNTESRFVLLNTPHMQHLGVANLDDVVGKTDFDFYPPDLAQKFYADEQALIRFNQPLLNKEEPNRTRDTSTRRWMLTTKVPLRDAQEQVIGLVGISRDITERKHLEEQLRQAQKMECVGRLSGGVAHDFNNLLTAIGGYTELVRDALTPTHPAYPDLETIHSATQRAKILVRQLLTFARQQPLAPQVLNLNELILNLDKLLRRLISEHIELVTLPFAGLGYVQADPNQIEQVVVNLAVNARDAMPTGGVLTIETANVTLDDDYAHQHANVSPGPYVLLAVSDTGIGMSPEVQARLFEPFFTTKEVGQGTGLGLATCYSIVKQHGGHIWIYSEVGQGTTVKIYLPRLTDNTIRQPAAEERAAILPRGEETVLLVEDEGAVRHFVGRVLRRLGYTVLEATNGEEALQVAAEYEGMIHLLLTDMVMPQMGGKVLADRLQPRQPGLKVLFVSGYTDSGIVHQGVLEAGIAFLQKPFSPEQLARKVREVLEAR
ncbi:MAG: hybrid sensor histidine kinase/response regulator [Anaerolineae bacterium]|nr:response regulator [Anaerolineales bacterium]MCQ3973582.1 hybrid sensor histidine kinase/response regulator [Anaerolineae bacterium]